MANYAKGMKVWDKLSCAVVTVTSVTSQKNDDGRWVVYYNTDAMPCRDASTGWRQSHEVTIKNARLKV